MTPIASAFGRNLKKLRTHAGLSLQELAERIGSSSSALQRYEVGERFPSGEVIDALAAALHVESAVFFDNEAVEREPTLHECARQLLKLADDIESLRAMPDDTRELLARIKTVAEWKTVETALVAALATTKKKTT